MLKEISKDEFFATVGPMDVHPTPIGKWPYTSVFKTRSGQEVGRIVGYLPDGSRLPKSRYYVVEGS